VVLLLLLPRLSKAGIRRHDKEDANLPFPQTPNIAQPRKTDLHALGAIDATIGPRACHIIFNRV
jgi:hypothetical protein